MTEFLDAPFLGQTTWLWLIHRFAYPGGVAISLWKTRPGAAVKATPGRAA